METVFMGWEKPEYKKRIVRVTNSLVRWYGISPRTSNRALKTLQDAGLVDLLETRVGRTPVVRLKFTRIKKSEVKDD